MNSLDANVVLRFLLWDIPEQSAKAERLINSSHCYVTDVTLTEVIFVLEKLVGIQRGDIAKLLKKFLTMQKIASNDQVLNDAIDLYERRAALSFPDCYAAVEAFKQGAYLATFDKRLLKYGGSHVTEP